MTAKKSNPTNRKHMPTKKKVSKKTKKQERYVIVRSNLAGVFAGVFVSRKEREVVLKDARRIWYWSGAASLSQLATTGTSNPDDCKFPAPVSRVELLESFEILDCTSEARKSIEEVPVWVK